MSIDIDLGTIARIVDRPGAKPAPTAGGNDSRPDTGPGNGGRPGPCVAVKACGCGVLDGEDCDCADFAAQWHAAQARPIYLTRHRRAAA